METALRTLLGFPLPSRGGERGERRKAMETRVRANWPRSSSIVVNAENAERQWRLRVSRPRYCRCYCRGERGERRKAMETFGDRLDVLCLHGLVVNAENAERQWRHRTHYTGPSAQPVVVNAENAERQWRLLDFNLWCVSTQIRVVN